MDENHAADLAKYQCSRCHTFKVLQEFSSKSGGRRSSWCKACKREAEAQRRRGQGIQPRLTSVIHGHTKECLACRKMLPFEMFHPSKRGLGGLASYCKDCFTDKYATKERSRRHTQAYRTRHAERWRAMRRVHDFERRSRRKAASDGTVTDGFLKQLYAQEICAYCEEPTPEHLRTADHRVPLIRGGLHSASNMVMACLSCNSSKQDTPAEEFKERVMREKQRPGKKTKRRRELLKAHPQPDDMT